MIRISVQGWLAIAGLIGAAIPTVAVLALAAGPVEAAFSSSDLGLLVGTALLGILVAGGLLFVVGRALGARLRRTGDSMQLLAGGDLTVRTGMRSAMTEAQSLADTFDHSVASNLQVIMLGMRELAQENRELIHKLSAGADRSRQTSREIVESTASVKERIARLEADIGKTSKSFDEINHGIEELKGDLESQASAVDETSSSVEQMSASIDSVASIANERNEATGNLVEVVQAGGSQAQSSNEIIEEIANGVEEISSMVSVINTVAAQTRILSMNAAIEAAHAGDYGRGFAVVADEIRKLAESTSQNTSQISNTLQEFVKRIYAAREASTKTGESFSRISEEIDGFVQAFTEISQSTSELASGSKEMVSGVGSLRDSATRIQERSESIRANTRKINEAVESVHEFSSETRGQMDELNAEANRIVEEQQGITETGERSDACIEQLMTELKYFTMARGEAGTEHAYDAEMKKIILDHKKRVVGAQALLDGRMDVEHVPQRASASECLLAGWLKQAERGRFDADTLSGLRQDHERFHQRYNELLDAYEASDTENARSLLEETERTWRKLIDYRETFSEILSQLKRSR